MNILLMTDKLETGGAEMYFCRLENKLTHANMNFYTAAGGGELLSKLKGKNHFLLLSRTNHLTNLIRLKKWITEKQIDVLHANSLRMVMYAVVLKKIVRHHIRIYYTKHNVTLLEGRFRSFFSNLLNQYVHRIITVSDFEKENLLGYGVNAAKITTIYNGVDLEQFTFKKKEKGENGSFKIGILARLSEEKNHRFFLEVAKALRDVPDLSFVIGGEGAEEKRLQEEIKQSGMSHKVKMIGAVTCPENFIAEMDILLLTSNREVFPMVILEAMAVGTPIITINKGGIKEAITDQESGIIVDHHCVNAFCESILRLRSNEVMRNKVIKHARKKVISQFSLDQMVNRTIQTYLMR